MARKIPSIIGSIIAVVAVLLIHMDMKAVIAPQENRMRDGLLPTQDQERIVRARRLSIPCTIIASASIKLPIKRNIIGSENGAKATLASAIPRTTHSTTPNRAVTGIGMASLIQ